MWLEGKILTKAAFLICVLPLTIRQIFNSANQRFTFTHWTALQPLRLIQPLIDEAYASWTAAAAVNSGDIGPG